MYYEPNARITVGNVVFNNVNQVEITESVKELGDKATVVLPRNYKKIAGKGVLDYIRVGDKVTIELGFDSDYFHEFSGFLGEIESSAPLILHVDDSFYPLKRNNFIKAWESITLRQLLEYIAPDYTVDCPDVNLGTFQISGVSSYRVLKTVSEQYGFYAKIFGNTLKCWWAYDFNSDIINTYALNSSNQLRMNVKKNNLKYHRAEDVKLRVKGISNLRNGKKLTYETGDLGEDVTLRTRNFGAISKNDLIEAVEKEYKRFAFDGYSGSIIGFAYPRTHAGDTLKIVDDQEPEREGKYLVEKTIIRYGLSSGYERENTLSFKV